MTLRYSGRLAIHRRSDEIAFLRHRIRVLDAAFLASEARNSSVEATSSGSHIPDIQLKVLMRERELADEFLHTRQIEPLGETLQRRLAMAERVCRDLGLRVGTLPQQAFHHDGPRSERSGGGTEPDTPSAEARRVPGSTGGAAGIQSQGEPGQPGDRDRFPGAYWIAMIERQALTEMLEHWWAWLRKS